MQRRGFTVVELLVVVAIVGILAAMLFPAFARAREEARWGTCLTNVRDIARAMRMYVADYDGRLFPGQHDARALAYFGGPGSDCDYSFTADPYLRVPVILSSYLPRRTVWQCPEAKRQTAATWIVPSGPNGDWLQDYISHQGSWGQGKPGGPCYTAWPSGWGGAVTDSFVQGMPRSYEPDPGAFAESIGPNTALTDLTLDQVHNPYRYVVVGDYSNTFAFRDAEGLAFPDTCGTRACGQLSGCTEMSCAGGDWVNCPWTSVCRLDEQGYRQFMTSASFRKHYTRHFGGSNLGFLDGHARWYPSDYLVKHAEPFPQAPLEGICSCWIGSVKYLEPTPAE